MGTQNNHMNLYEIFKKDAENINNSKQSRVEMYFLSNYHLIEACVAKQNIHINKHQRLRKILEENTHIFEEKEGSFEGDIKLSESFMFFSK